MQSRGMKMARLFTGRLREMILAGVCGVICQVATLQILFDLMEWE
jgi:hypothetical protein